MLLVCTKNGFHLKSSEKISVLDPYFIHRYIITKYRQVPFRVKSANYYGSYGPFSTSLLAKCFFRVRMAPGWGHLCHIDAFLVIST